MLPHHPSCCTQSGNAKTNKGLQTQEWIFPNYLFHFLVGSSIHTRSKKIVPNIGFHPWWWILYVNMLPYPQKFPHRPNPTAGRPNGKPHNITRLCPGAKGTPIEPAGGVRLSPWQENHFPPVVGDGFTLLPTPNIFFTTVFGYDFLLTEIFAGYLKPPLSCWDSLN